MTFTATRTDDLTIHQGENHVDLARSMLALARARRQPSPSPAPPSADKMKATLDSASEVPATTTAGKGTADIDFDPATKKLTWKLTYSGLTGPATMAHFHGPAEAGKNAGVAVPIHSQPHPARRQRHADRRTGRRPRWPASTMSTSTPRPIKGRRDPRTGDEVTFVPNMAWTRGRVPALAPRAVGNISFE